jgi:hypothetical protein
MIRLMTEEQLATLQERRDLCEEDPCGSPNCAICATDDTEFERPVRFIPGSVCFVNVYRVQRCFGGPEEGGWWYDAGELVEVWAFPNEAAARAKKDALEQGEYSNEGERPLSSVISRGVWRLEVSETPGRDWPERIPRYE